MKFIALSLIVVTSSLCFSCTTYNFLKLCKYSDMTYSKPEGFKPAEVKQNPDLVYQYAVKHRDKKLEIRYSIFPLKKEVEEYNKYLKGTLKKNIMMIDPNIDHELSAITTAMNISRSEIPREFNASIPAPNPNDFNADWGTAYFVENNSEYGKGYTYSLVVAIHKKNIANAFIVYLFDDDKDTRNEIISSMHNLKFK